MKVLIFLACCLALAFGEHDAHGCSDLAREKVKTQWAAVYQNHRQALGTALWRAMFAREPDMVKLFDRVGGDDVTSPAFMAHSGRVLGGLDMVISIMDRHDVLDAALAHLNKQHKDDHIPAGYFNVMRDALSEVIPAALGRCFDTDAWSPCWDVIVHGMAK